MANVVGKAEIIDVLYGFLSINCYCHDAMRTRRALYVARSIALLLIVSDRILGDISR